MPTSSASVSSSAPRSADFRPIQSTTVAAAPSPRVSGPPAPSPLSLAAPHPPTPRPAFTGTPPRSAEPLTHSSPSTSRRCSRRTTRSIALPNVSPRHSSAAAGSRSARVSEHSGGHSSERATWTSTVSQVGHAGSTPLLQRPRLHSARCEYSTSSTAVCSTLRTALRPTSRLSRRQRGRTRDPRFPGGRHQCRIVMQAGCPSDVVAPP